MDNSGECSRPKKPKSCTDHNSNGSSEWALLPSVVLEQIFDLLNARDRKNASTVCRQWRKIHFHPKWWPTMKFKIEHDNIAKAKFYSSTFGRVVMEATVVLDSLSPECIYEFIYLLKLLNENNRLRSLILEPSHCRIMDTYTSFIKERSEKDVIEIFDFLIAILPRLTSFSLGGLEDLARYSDTIITSLTPCKVKLLGLASVKEDLLEYEENCFKADALSPFKNLQILSIDYDQLSDDFLYNLEELKHFNRLVVHIHSVPQNHCGTSNAAWRDFRVAHPQCLLRLTVIHAYRAIHRLHRDVLRKEMPLSHIKVFFCEDVNVDVLHILSTSYTCTLRSVVWIDSISDTTSSWRLTDSAESPDPFVLMSWLCASLEELVLYGYKYPEENLVAISRLKGTKMKRLEIPTDDIYSGYGYGYQPDNFKDVAKNLQFAWNPVYKSDLHPVILDPNSGDSDEFLLPYVLADLH
ncbi:F-box only protein 33 [Euwallacea similis]|uniref:F-box only protein 33 n=1 Tax=Euwallacea similis TaxID=1736056 RepID=UPI00344DC226